MSKEEILEEINDLGDFIEDKFAEIKQYIINTRDISPDVELALDDLEISKNNFNEELDNFSNII